MTSAAAHPRAAHPIAVPHSAVPLSAVARWALAVALILGVLGMHTLMGPPAAAGATGDATTTDVSMSTAAAPGVVGGTAHADQPATPGDGATPLGGHSPAGGHSTLTMCLAVLGSLAALVLLVASALARRPAVVDPPDGVHPVGVRFSLGRPPPWTVPSLHQLSLLRK